MDIGTNVKAGNKGLVDAIAAARMESIKKQKVMIDNKQVYLL